VGAILGAAGRTQHALSTRRMERLMTMQGKKVFAKVQKLGAEA